MDIRIARSTAEQIGKEKFKPFISKGEEFWSYRTEAVISLAAMSVKKIKEFKAIFTENASVRGAKTIIKDIETWEAALNDEVTPKARAVRNFEPLLIRVLGQNPDHRIFKRVDGENYVWLCYYVNKITFHPSQTHNYSTTPAHVTMDLLYEEFMSTEKEQVTFWDTDCVNITVIEALARKNFYMEIKESRARYVREAARCSSLIEQIGKQYWARGVATDDMDGNPGRSNSWYWNRTNTVNMERAGDRSRVVIDIIQEDEKEDRRDRDASIDTWFWISSENESFIKASKEDDEIEQHEVAESLDIKKPDIEIPIHPFVAVFDLRKHLRLRIHVNYLEEYVYDTEIGEKLVLPQEQKDLVKALIHHDQSLFHDIIGGKSGGAVVLLAGPPGTGKTLTAEVYAESEERALYSVQCSQLGTDPEKLEDELLKVFARCKRWKAVLLLDEADVYVHERGNDLLQNAIVGVFLRVLEYQSNVLFLTTNRPDDVDDAIASRCVARLDYTSPSEAEQARIWKVLAASSSLDLPEAQVKLIVAQNPGISGRDVKNLLKLSQMVALQTKKPITAATVKFSTKFKPTRTGSKHELPDPEPTRGGRP